MALGNSAESVISLISTIDTLIENFPMSILSLLKGKQYSSVIEFILDVLYICGVDTDEITRYIMESIFASEGMQNAATWIEKAKLATSEETLLEALNSVNMDVDSKFISVLEDSIKVALGSILNALLSCSIYPVIPDWCMDEYRNRTVYGKIKIPVNCFDLCNKLSIAPNTSTGACFYNVDSEKVFKKLSNTLLIPSIYLKAIGEAMKDDSGINKLVDVGPNRKIVYFSSMPLTDERNFKYLGKYFAVKNKTDNTVSYYRVTYASILDANDMYRTDDLDAFLWYVLNRGELTPQTEYNKCMWDSRYYVNKYFIDGYKKEKINRHKYDGTEWAYWLTSKQSANGDDCDLYYKGSTIDNNPGSGVTGYYEKSKLFPIMQLEKSTKDNTEPALNVMISSQKYRNNTESELASLLYPNKTMYTFNYDYLTGIKIFNTKSILASLIKQLYAYGIFKGASNFGLTTYIQSDLLADKIKKIIKNVIEVDDMSVEDCYYKFSNDDYNYLLTKDEQAKFNVVMDCLGNYHKKPYNQNDITDVVDEMSSNPTISGTITTITRSAYEVSDYGTDNNEGNPVSYQQFLENFIMACVYPFAEALFTPKVILLICINMQVSGIVDFDYLNFTDTDYVINFITKKIMAVISSMIIIIKNHIIEMLLILGKKYIVTLINQFISLILSEKIEIWIEYLEQILNCIPTFNFKDYKAQIAEVNYADIEVSEATEPESTKTC